MNPDSSAAARTYTFRDVTVCVMCGGTAFKSLGRRLDRSQGGRPRRKVGISVAVVRCQTCGLIFPQPLPIPATLSQHYGLSPEEYWSAERVAFTEPMFQQEIATALEILGRSAEGLSALDVGSGLGSTLRALQDAGFDATGIEPSPTFRAAAIERMGVDPARIIEASFDDPTTLDELKNRVAPGGFDFITFGAVLEHVIDPGAAIEGALNVLGEGGVVHAEVPSARWLMSRLFNAYYTLRGTDFVTHLSPMHPPFHLYEFTMNAFERHGRNHGYRVVRHSRMAGDTFVPGPLDGIARRLMQATGTGLQLTVWLQKGNAPR